MSSRYSDTPHNAAEKGESSRSQIAFDPYARYSFSFDSSMRSVSPAGSALSRSRLSPSPSVQHRDVLSGLHSSPRVRRTAVPSSSFRGSGASMSPPLFEDVSHPSQASNSLRHEDPRSLPSRNINDETINDAYVAFILYCNPGVPLSVDTSELRRAFRSPPRSDGKSFSIFTLWELIVKLDKKELKTWIQLATELGVEPPSAEKKQSTQKVQQYAVRLKRWMRAMHVDAFFEYCLGHSHSYYTKLPSSGGMPSESRDGVPLEEDLALRCLLPEWKPKRGRKKADDSEGSRSAKRPMLDTSVAGLHVDLSSHAANFPQSAIPFSAFPDDLDATDPWVAASPFHTRTSTGLPVDQGQDFRWRPFERYASPVVYPHSAVLPPNRHASEEFSVEPRSAVTLASKERSRVRRRHGPAVSSAWPSHGTSTGKIRGRPPNKTLSTGQFSSFPANPGYRESPSGEAPTIYPSRSLAVQNDARRRSSRSPPRTQSLLHPSNSRPGRLQLQVPQLPSGPVRLATPPTLLINGVDSTPGSPIPEEDNGNISRAGTPRLEIDRSQSDADTNDRPASHKISTDDLVKVFTLRLLHAKLVGRSIPLTSEEAKDLAQSVIQKLSASFVGIDPKSTALLCAMHLGIGRQVGLDCGPSGPVTVKATVHPPASDRQSSTTDSKGSWCYSVSYEYCPVPGIVINVVHGSVGVAISRKDTVFPDDSNDATTLDSHSDDDINDELMNASETTWKQRYMKLRKQMRKKEQAFGQYKRSILEAVMADM